MFRLFCRLMFWLNGWKVDKNSFVGKQYKKFVLVGGPHTSNWDAVYFIAAMQKMGLKARFLIKKEWIRFPFGIVFKPLGGLGVDRRPKESKRKLSMVSVMVDFFKNTDNMIIAISPEGTRSGNVRWKKGFYYTAIEAKVPILLGYLDYKKKVAGITKVIFPCGNINQDLQEISNYYLQFSGKIPSLYAPFKP